MRRYEELSPAEVQKILEILESRSDDTFALEDVMTQFRISRVTLDILVMRDERQKHPELFR